MERPVRWMDMTPDEFIDARKEHPVAYIPYGHAEAHGNYNALGMDWYSADMICQRLAERFGGICAPGLMFHTDEEPYMNWGVNCCGMGEQFCSGISNSLFLHNVLYHIRLVDARGFKAALLISGHAVPGMSDDVNRLIEYYKMKTGSPIQVEFCDYPDYSEDDFKRVSEQKPPKFHHHAGFAETALLMALKPELAHPELLGTETKYPEAGGGVPGKFDAYCAPSGFCKTEDGMLPTREYGEKLADVYVTDLGKRAAELLGAYDETAERPAAPDFYELEAIWHSFYEATHRYWGSNLGYLDYEAGVKTQKFPGWDAVGVKAKK